MAAKLELTVSQLNEYVRRMFQMDPMLRAIELKGEISNLKFHQSGALFFTMKDENAAISCVMYADEAENLQAMPFEGMRATASGSVALYARGGQYQFVVKRLHAQGVGVLYARKGIPLFPLIEGGAQERGRRAGTENVPGVMGLAAALKESCAHLAENAAKVSALRDRLIAGLSKIPHSVLNGDPVHRLPGNVSFCFEGIEGESMLLLLDGKGICASSGSACTSGSLDPSHVLLAIGRPHEVAHGSLRLTLCESNTEAEIDHILACVPEIVAYLRGMSPVWRDLVEGKKSFIL